MLWPMLLDYSRNECKRYLRKLELEAYASIVSAFRAQGELSKDKKKMLNDLGIMLSISMERHKAEIRRAVNDEKLNTIAERMVGPNTATDWAIEGRRLVPLMPRLVPQTAFTTLATNLANLQAAKNATMPLPNTTGQQGDCDAQEESKPAAEVTSPLQGSQPTTPVKGQQSVSVTTPLSSGAKVPPANSFPGTPLPATNNNHVVLLPSGMAIQLKDEEQEGGTRKRKRSTSLDSTTPQAAKVLVTSALSSGSSPGSTSPIVMTSTPSPVTARINHGLPVRGQQIHKTTIQGAQGGSKQVILVSGSSASLPPSILQRCLSVPMPGKTVPTPVSSATYKSTATSTYSVASSPSATALSTVSSVLSSHLVTASPAGSGNMLVYTTTSRPRSRTAGPSIRPAFRPRALAGSMSAGQPGGPGAVQFPTPSTALKIQTGVPKPPATYLRTPGLFRQDSNTGVKILTQSIQPSSIVRPRSTPSPSSFGLGNTASKPTAASQNVGTTPRIVNVMSVNPSARVGGTSLISARLPAPTTKLGQAIASRINSGTGGTKPNVIVVHKAQVWPQQQQQQLGQGAAAFVVTKSGQTFKDIMTYSQKQQQTLMKNTGVSVMKPALSGLAQTRTVQTASNTVTITTTTSMPTTSSPSSSILELDPSQVLLDEQKNSLLADLIEAAGIAPDAAAAAAAAVVSVAMETFPPQMQTTTVTTTVAPSASPVSLVSSFPTPCVAEVADDMDAEAEDRQESSNSDLELHSIQLGDLLGTESSNFTSQEIPFSTSLADTTPSETSVTSTSSEKTPTPASTKIIKTKPSTVVANQQSKGIETESSLTENEPVQELEMPLDQMPEGQVLEIQAPDAAALLNSDGQLSKEVLEILHQAGFQLQNDQVTIDTSGLDLSGRTVELHLEGASDDSSDKKKEEDGDSESQISPQLDNAIEMLYLPSSSDDQQKDDAKEDAMPSIVSVFSSGVLHSSQLDLDTLQIVEDVLALKTASPAAQESLLQNDHPAERSAQQIETSVECSVTSSADAPESFLGLSDLHSELTVVGETDVVEETATDMSNVIVESAEKPYMIPRMSIDNVMVEVDSTELVISGEEVQVGSSVSNVLVQANDYSTRDSIEFM